MAKKYDRVSGCLSLDDANRLWHDLIAYRKATRQPENFTRRKYGTGWAIFKVITVSELSEQRTG